MSTATVSPALYPEDPGRGAPGLDGRPRAIHYTRPREHHPLRRLRTGRDGPEPGAERGLARRIRGSVQTDTHPDSTDDGRARVGGELRARPRRGRLRSVDRPAAD